MGYCCVEGSSQTNPAENGTISRLTGAWDLLTEPLTWFRQHHTSWTPANGSVTYLMGGSPSAYPSEVVDLDNGRVNESFPLQHPAFPLQ